MAEKGFISKKATNWMSEQLDAIIVLKGLLETFDGPALNLAIGTIDDVFGEKIPDPYKSNVRDAIDLVIFDQNIDLAEQKLTELMVLAINVPWLDDDSEKRLFGSLLNFIISMLYFFLQKRKKDLAG